MLPLCQVPSSVEAKPREEAAEGWGREEATWSRVPEVRHCLLLPEPFTHSPVIHLSGGLNAQTTASPLAAELQEHQGGATSPHTEHGAGDSAPQVHWLFLLYRCLLLEHSPQILVSPVLFPTVSQQLPF